MGDAWPDRGDLTPATGWDPVNTVMLRLIERLEANLPDGTEDVMVSTGGDEIDSGTLNGDRSGTLFGYQPDRQR